jgi:putative tricarboxylic transport membrane protein
MDAGTRPTRLAAQRADVVGALVWIVFGLAIVASALAMPRMENQGGTLYNAPGLVPGLLGLAIAGMGALLGVRAWRRAGDAERDPSTHYLDAGHHPQPAGQHPVPPGRDPDPAAHDPVPSGQHPASTADDPDPFARPPDPPTAVTDRRGLLIGAALALVYAAGLVGRGVPFWLATWLFVTAYVLIFEWRQRGAAGQRVKGVALALVYGAGTAGLVSVLFEQVFFVRLP